MTNKKAISILCHRSRDEKTSQPHVHENPSLMFVVSGSGQCKVNKTHYDLSEDQFLLIDAGIEHALIDKTGHPMVVFVVYFKPEILPIPLTNLKELFKKQIFFHTDDFSANQIKLLLRQMLHEQEEKSKLYHTALEIQLSQILLICLRWTKRKKEQKKRTGLERTRIVLEDLSRYIHLHHTLGDAAKLAGLTQRQFSSHCKKILGQSYIQYINKKRCLKAKELLLKSKTPVTAISFEVGFEDLSTFYRAFKKHIGVNPKEVRGESI